MCLFLGATIVLEKKVFCLLTMSEDEQFEDFEQYEQYEDEQDDRELIAWVKANSFLYNKSEKLYSNNEVKNSAWDAIGNNLTNKKTGPEAEHRFFQLRQRFGRERRKVVQSQPRSGAGTSQPIYSSKWILYNDLMFLADVIKHRNTTTNYKKKHPKSQPIHQVNLPTSLNLTSPSNSSSSLWNEELSINSSDDVPECSNMSDKESLLALQTPQSSSQSVGRSSFAVSDSSRIASLKKIQAITREKRVPELDSFAKQKKQHMDKFNQTITEQSKCLTALVQKVEGAISVNTPPSEPQVTDSLNSLRPDIRAMLSVIAFSLQKLSESKQLDFLITIIQLLKQHTEGDATT